MRNKNIIIRNKLIGLTKYCYQEQNIVIRNKNIRLREYDYQEQKY